MKSFFIFAISFSFICVGEINAQHWNWINRAGSSNTVNPGLDRSYVTRTDLNGFIFVLYWFNYPANNDSSDAYFGGNPVVDPYLTGQTYVAKYDSLGSLVWAKNLFDFVDESYGPTDYVHPYSMELDSNGNIYIAGELSADSILFNGDTILNVLNGGERCFVVKCDSTLTKQWIFYSDPISGTGATAYDIKLDAHNNLFCSGTINGISIFGTDTITDLSNAETNFLMKFSTNGSIENIATIYSTLSLQEPHITIDTFSNVFIANNFIGNINYQSNSISIPSSNAAILKVDSNFTFLNWISLPQMTVECITSVDSSLIMCGRYYGTVSLPIGTYSANSLDGFCLKMGVDGTYSWFNTLNISNSNSFNSLAVSRFGNIFVTGYYRNSFSWNSINFTPVNLDDILVLKLDSIGQIRWITSGGSIGNDISTSITTDYQERVYVCGTIASPNNTFGSLSIATFAGGDAFIGRINTYPCQALNASISPSADTILCQNDSIPLSAISNMNEYYWTTGEQSQTIWARDEGYYSYYCIDSNGCYRQGDNIFIDVKPDIVLVGSATHACQGSTIDLHPSNIAALQTFNWSDSTHNDTAFIFTNGFYWLTAIDTNGCSGNSDTVNIIFSEPTAYFRDSNLCTNSTSYFFDSSYCNLPGEFINWWRWNFNPGLSTLQNPTHVYSNSGNNLIQLIVRNNYYCYDTATFFVQINSAPMSSITISNDTLISLDTNNIQWYLNGNPLVGSNNQELVYSQPGIYSVINTNECGSDTAVFLITNQIQATFQDSSSYRIFPNPSNKHITIQKPNFSNEPITIQIFDGLGNIKIHTSITPTELDSGHALDLSSLDSGVYFISVDCYRSKFILIRTD